MENLKNLKAVLTEHREKIKQLKDVMKSEFQEKLKIIFKEIFATYPQIENLNWEQYTPYFNDGDPCEFSFNDLRVKLKPEYLKDKKTYEEYEEEGFYTSDLNDPSEKENSETSRFVNLPEGLAEDLNTLDDILRESEDALKDVFGDHVSIIVTPEKLEVTDYDHD